MEKNILLLLIIINSRKIYLMQRWHKKIVNEFSLNKKIKTLAQTKKEIKKLATKAKLKAEEDKIVNFQTNDFSIFISQSYFVNDGSQLYLILQPLYHASIRLGNTEKVVPWNNLKVCWPKILLLLLLLMIVFPYQLDGTYNQIFV